jgi:hypothetical protein
MEKLGKKLKQGRPKSKHHGYSFLAKGTLPEDKVYILRYLTAVREGLIQDLGPTEKELTTAQVVLIDRVTTKLGVIRCIEEYIRENTVMTGSRLSPSLRESYLAYNNSIRLDLQALGIDKRKGEEVIDLYKYVDEKYGKKGKGKKDE